MLSGDRQHRGEKQQQVLLAKKQLCYVKHTFFAHFFAVVLHDYNVKLSETSQLHVLFRTCSRSLLFTAAHFHLALMPLAFLILSPLLQNFHVVLPTKNCLLCFFHLSLQISVAVFLDNAFSSLLTLQLSLLYKTPVAMRFPAKITSSCIWVAIPID